MIAGVVKESYPGERRVALAPNVLGLLAKGGVEVIIESGAGTAAGFSDGAYEKAGARLVSGRAEVFRTAEVLLQVWTASGHPEGDEGVAAELELLRDDLTVIGQAAPLDAIEAVRRLAGTGVQSFALELVPRITRSQSMDVLSSQATIGGYKAVLLAAMQLPKMAPMMMTAAGTLSPAKAFIVGAGVAGLQAISSARRLGAVVSAYDIRPVVKEQVESLGAKFVEIELEAGASEDKGGYAKAMDDSFYRRQRDLMAQVVAESDIVITTAAIPGRKAPELVTAEMVHGMAPGSVLVDLAAERGGNCELTRPGETVVERGVTIIGPINLASTVPNHASQMYGRNVATFLLHMVKEGQLVVDTADEITDATLLTRGGEVVQKRVRELLGLETADVAAQGGTAS